MARSKLIILISLVVLMSVPATSALAAASGTGTAVASDANGLSDRINISMTGVAHPADGKAYEGWLVSDDGETKTSLGILDVSGGTISHEYISPTGEDLVQSYGEIMITVEPVSDTDSAPSGDVAFSDKIPTDAVKHIRVLLKDSLSGLRTQLDAAIAEATLAKDATTLADVVLHTNKAIAIIDGETGVLALASGRTNANNAAGRVDDSVVDSHALLVDKYGKNAADWATSAKTTAQDKVLSQTDVTLAKLFIGPGSETVLGYLNAARSGFGATGGAEQAYVEGQLMGSYVLGDRPTSNIAIVDAELPSVGDQAVQMLMQISLLTSLLFLATGSLMALRSRSWRSHSRS